MSVQERIRMCRIIDQMQTNPETCKRLGLENKSTFHGNEVDKDEKINKKL